MSMSCKYLLCIVTTIALFSAVTNGVPLSKFYPYGTAAGPNEQFLPRNDDNSSPPISLQRVFPFFGRDHIVCYVNNNGDISFTEAISTFTPLPFPLGSSSGLGDELQLIAPFWADVDTRSINGGFVSYRQSTDTTLLKRAQKEIQTAFSPQHSSFTPTFLFIATWDRVGYFSEHDDKTNTFQCLMATDGVRSFVIFLYADGLINWTTGDASDGVNGLGGIPAQVGFNSGDGETFFAYEDSRTPEIINIASNSNVNVSGMFIFRVDTAIDERDACSIDSNVKLTIVPRIGNMLGGTPILISGLCQDPVGAERKCFFDDQDTPGMYISSTTMLCVTPIMKRSGVVLVRVVLNISQGESREAEARFTALSPDNAHSVSFKKTTLPANMFENLRILFSDYVLVSWNPREVVPAHIIETDKSFNVSIEMYSQLRDGKWERFDFVNQMNTGSATVELKSNVRCEGLTTLSENLCPMAFKVSIQEKSVSIVIDNTNTLTETIPGSVGIWSGILYIEGKEASPQDLAIACRCWSNKCSDPKCNGYSSCNGAKGEKTGEPAFASSLPPCPPTEKQAKIDATFVVESMSSFLSPKTSNYPEVAMSFFHPGVSKCYRQREIASRANPHGQQCCYLENGNLCVGAPGGGSADIASPSVNYNEHIMKDLLPYAFCCRGSSTCQTYYSERPSGNSRGYQLQVPATSMGDPHLVTLDGLQYTFNGKGEFTLVETIDNTFILQGRMEQLLDSSGGLAPGTVFKAVVATQFDGSFVTHVEFQVLPSGFLDILVNRERIVISDSLEQVFEYVTVSDLGNETFSADFSNGPVIRVSAENKFISVLSVSLPLRFSRKTRGLLGTFDDNVDNDFIPKGEAIPLPSDLSIEDIHNLFGITWIIKNPSESNFAYNMPRSSWEFFYDPNFTPVFETVFDDPLLEKQALDTCGNDTSCLFDISTTKRVEVGVLTKKSSEDLMQIMELARPKPF